MQRPDKRAGLLDEIRGGDIIVMILYHLGYDLVYIFGVEVPFYRSFITPYIQPLIAGTFIVLSGISCRYSRSNLKRGVKTFLLGMVLTAVTCIFMPSEAIYFGILHFMGAAMILFYVFRFLLDKIRPLVGMPLFLALYVLTGGVPRGYVGISGVFTFRLPLSLYQHRVLLPLGFFGAGSDYFPLIPYLFLYFSAAYAGVLVKNGSFPDFVYRTHSAFLSAIGRCTIIVYLLHQPVIMGILTLVLG